MKRILITGGQGMLATDLTAQLSGEGRYDLQPMPRHVLDVTLAAKVGEVLKGLKPDVVIHTAALHVDPCEEDPSEAFRVNAWATRALARICEKRDVTLVYISTCGLFGDRMKAYTEYDPVVLKTTYARSKYEGESFVRQFCRRFFIVRPGWLFGGLVSHTKNFAVRRYEEALNVPVIRSVKDKYGSPTFTKDLAGAISALLRTDEYGVYHLTNLGGGSRAAYVRRILECFGLRTEVEEVDSSHFPRRADVPDCEMLEGMNIRFLGLEALPPWEEAVERYVREIKGEIGVG